MEARYLQAKKSQFKNPRFAHEIANKAIHTKSLFFIKMLDKSRAHILTKINNTPFKKDI